MNNFCSLMDVDWSYVFCSQELFVTASCFIGTDLCVLHCFMFVSTIQSPLASEVLKFGPNNAGKSNELNAFQFVLLHMVPFGKKKNQEAFLYHPFR